MKKGKNKILFDKINRIGGKIFICDIVYKEILNNYKKQLNEINIQIDKIDNLKLKQEENILLHIYVKFYIKEVERRFKEYISEEKVIKLPINNEILSEVIDRSIKSKKTFSEKLDNCREKNDEKVIA